MYYATICKLTNVRKAPNSDNLNLANVCGAQIIVGKEVKDGDLGIFFPSEGRLSEAFCKANDLIGEKKYFNEKRRVKCIKLRGNVSEGVWFPLSYLSYLDPELSALTEGLDFTEYKGQLICEKYITPQLCKIGNNNRQKEGRVGKKHPLFKEHFDTSHLSRNLHTMKKGDLVVITTKMHGTSSRVMLAPINNNYGWFKKTLAKLLGMQLAMWHPAILIGTRRVEIGGLNTQYEYDNHFYRRKMAQQIANKMRMGETVYSEIVGYDHNYKPIMTPVTKKNLGKDFAHYLNFNGESMHYKYGNNYGECSQYVYRITQTDENGKCYDLTWNQVKKRCIELEIPHVPELHCMIVGDDTTEIMTKAEILAYGSDPIDFSHIREGVVVRVENEFGINCYKHKSIHFRLLEDTVKEEVDLEDLS